MFTTKRVVALSLAVALLAGTLGILVGHTQNSYQGAYQGAYQGVPTETTGEYSAKASDLVADLREDTTETFNDIAYGYQDSYSSASNQQQAATYSNAPTRRVVRNVGYSDSQVRERVYYAPQQPKKRSFFQKHRDKLTVAAGAGGGALIGGLLGGKKWAGIGALIGGGGSALYTYKLRKRSPKN